MRYILLVAMLLVAPGVACAQPRKTPVYLSHKGEDAIGKLLAIELKRQIEKSPRYRLDQLGTPKEGTKFFVKIVTLDVSGSGPGAGLTSAASVVVEALEPMERQYAFAWYHKLMLVGRENVRHAAEVLLEDVDASWCRAVKNAPDTCPKELLP